MIFAPKAHYTLQPALLPRTPVCFYATLVVLVIILSRKTIRHANSGNYGCFPNMQRTVF